MAKGIIKKTADEVQQLFCRPIQANIFENSPREHFAAGCAGG